MKPILLRISWLVLGLTLGVYIPAPGIPFTTISIQRQVLAESTTEVVIFSEDARDGVPFWIYEAERRFPDEELMLIFCHGNENIYGEWCLYADGYSIGVPVQLFLEELRKTDPDKKIIFIVCNPGGDVIEGENVVYADANVWVIPNVVYLDRHILDPDAAGNIYEFIEQ